MAKPKHNFQDGLGSPETVRASEVARLEMIKFYDLMRNAEDRYETARAKYKLAERARIASRKIGESTS